MTDNQKGTVKLRGEIGRFRKITELRLTIFFPVETGIELVTMQAPQPPCRMDFQAFCQTVLAK
jgi:hypothetical protein